MFVCYISLGHPGTILKIKRLCGLLWDDQACVKTGCLVAMASANTCIALFGCIGGLVDISLPINLVITLKGNEKKFF